MNQRIFLESYLQKIRILSRLSKNPVEEPQRVSKLLHEECEDEYYIENMFYNFK
jgi:hypothetical protein